MTKTIAVKIGVVVGSDGSYGADVVRAGEDKYDWRWMEEVASDYVPTDTYYERHIVTAEIPVPTIPEIQGKAEKVE